jgi:monoterpene epsilon-lactone hydrolase
MWLITTLVVRAIARVCARRLRSGPRVASWSFRLECEIELCRLTWATMGTQPVDVLRSFDAQAVPRSRVAGPVERRDATIAGVPGLWVTPRGGAVHGTLIYLHGGVFTFGSPDGHFDLLARLALGGGVRVFAPRYRLAPEHPFPAAIDDCLALVRALRDAGTPAGELAIGGDSAGAHLALAALLRLRDAGDELPAAGLLISPWLDLTLATAAARADSPDFMPLDMLRLHAAAYAGGAGLADPGLAPLRARLDGLPALLVQAGGVERFLDEAAELVERVQQAAGRAELHVLADMPHEPHIFGFTAQAREAIARAGAFLRGAVQPAASLAPVAASRLATVGGSPGRNGTT